MIWRCDLTPQYLNYKLEIDDAISRVLSSGRYTLAGEVQSFEREFAQYVGVDDVISVGNGTDGLTLALQVAGVGPGDEVVTTPFTAIPTLSSIVDAGATPIFVDICLDTYLIDIEKIVQAITPRTKAIMPVHIFGNVVDIRRLRALVGDGMMIIEDAAQAHGASIRGEACGSMGDGGVFSFYPTKNLGAFGDGGAVATSNPDFAKQLRLRRMYGMVDKDHICMHGINSRLDELQAGILRVKLRYLDAMNERRRQIAARYRAELNPDLFIHQQIPEDVVPNYHVFVARVTGGRRDQLAAFLESRAIQTNVYYPLPLYRQVAMASSWKGVALPCVERLCSEVIALPMYAELPDDLLSRVLEEIKAFPS